MDIEVDLKPIVHDSTRSLIMVKNDAYILFSVSDAICAINVIAKLSHAGGPVPQVPFHRYVFEAGAGKVTAESSFTRTLGQRYRYDSVAFYRVPSFILEPGFKDVKVDIAYGGVFCAFVNTEFVELRLQGDQAEEEDTL